MSLKYKFLTIGAISSALAIILAVMGILVGVEFSSLILKSETASIALRNHLTADMMHDGLRSDVYRALYAADNAPQDREAVVADVKEHAQIFRNRIVANEKLDLPDEVKTTLFALNEPLDKYISMAELLVTQAFSDRQAALKLLPKFDQNFSALAGTMEHASTTIEKDLSNATVNAHAMSRISKKIMIAALVVAIIIGAGITVYMWRSLAMPIVNLASGIRHLADGDINIEISASNRKDEVGDMIRAVDVFKQNAIRATELEKEQAIQREKTEEEKRGMISRLASDFDTNIGSIVQSVSAATTELQATAESMSVISQQTNSQANLVASASEEASVNVQTVAEASDEMSRSIAEINQQVTEASSAARRAVEVVGKTTRQVEGLAVAANSVDQIISMISEIADQTNLLALNATIESARAGEAGKGFAVVASEVKELAGQTGKATEDISRQVQEIQKETRAAVDSMTEITKVIQSIDETSAAIASAMEEQGATTDSIAHNVKEAASGTKNVSQNITGVTEASTEADAAATSVMTAVNELSQQTVFLQSEVESFIKNMLEGPANRRSKNIEGFGPERRTSGKSEAA